MRFVYVVYESYDEWFHSIHEDLEEAKRIVEGTTTERVTWVRKGNHWTAKFNRSEWNIGRYKLGEWIHA